MRMALLVAQRSTCQRLQVGCVIVSADYRQVLACGYNGGASGQRNECKSLEPGQCGHLHAEINACLNGVSPRSQEKAVFVTDLPCEMCAIALVNLGGVARVYYHRDYRLRDGADVLHRAGIGVARMGEDLLPKWERPAQYDVYRTGLCGQPQGPTETRVSVAPLTWGIRVYKGEERRGWLLSPYERGHWLGGEEGAKKQAEVLTGIAGVSPSAQGFRYEAEVYDGDASPGVIGG